MMAKKEEDFSLINFFLVLVIIVNHLYVWLSHYYRIGAADRNHLDTLVVLSGHIIPAIAGGIFRLKLSPIIMDNKILKKPSKVFIKASLFIFLLESLKLSFTYSYQQALNWNVLHFLALSFILIVLLGRINTKLIGFVGLCVFFLTPSMRESVDLIFSLSADNIIESSNLAQIVLLVASVLYTAYHMAKNLMLLKAKKITHMFSWRLIVGCLFIFLFLMKDFSTPALNLSLFYLPQGILVGDIKSIHIWPLFPWFSLVVLGYLTFDFFYRIKNKNYFEILICVATFVTVVYYLNGGKEFFWSQVNEDVSWKSFRSSLPNMLFIFGFFFTYLFSYLIVAQTFKPFLKLRVFKFIDDSILWSYLLVTSFGIYMSRLLVGHFSYKESLVIGVIFHALMAVLIGYIMNSGLFKKRFVFKFKKIR